MTSYDLCVTLAVHLLLSIVVEFKPLSATNNYDYELTPSGDATTLTFAPGQRIASKTVSIIDDNRLEYEETFLVYIKVEDMTSLCGTVTSPWKSEVIIKDCK